MKKTLFLLLIISLLGCANKKEQLGSVNENNIQELVTDNSVFIGDESHNVGEDNLRYIWGSVCFLKINDDNVNIRSYPSLNADVLFKLDKGTEIKIIGTSKEMDNIDNYYGNWLNIEINEIINDIWIDNGWVFSKYVENGQFNSSELKIIEAISADGMHNIQYLKYSYQINNDEYIFSLPTEQEKSQKFCTFVYDHYIRGFHYSNIPGSYAWFPETNELKHITYMGTSMESAWVKFTDDFKYMLEDFGTSTGPRVLDGWRLEDGEIINPGMYYRDINLRGYTINIAYPVDRPYLSNNFKGHELTEIFNYAEEYKRNNPKPDGQYELIIICEYNLETGFRKILTGQYIYYT
jgi:hypothetical protein